MENKKKMILFLFLLFVTIPIISFATEIENLLTWRGEINVNKLKNLLSGEGVTISNVRLTKGDKDCRQIGHFKNAGRIEGFRNIDEGIILTTGYVQNTVDMEAGRQIADMERIWR